jgi:hypothetical protein
MPQLARHALDSRRCSSNHQSTFRGSWLWQPHDILPDILQAAADGDGKHVCHHSTWTTCAGRESCKYCVMQTGLQVSIHMSRLVCPVQLALPGPIDKPSRYSKGRQARANETAVTVATETYAAIMRTAVYTLRLTWPCVHDFGQASPVQRQTRWSLP